MWLIANTLKQPLHKGLIYTKDYPHTVSYCCKKQIQIDSFMELSKEKRPPKSMWHNPEKLEDWFDRVFDRKQKTYLDVIIDEVE